MSWNAPASNELRELARLGEGGREDRLHFKLVISILWRCMRLLRPVARHVALLCAGFAAVAIGLFPIVLVLFVVFWTRALQGEPMTGLEAAVLGLDPAVAVDVDALPVAVRQGLIRQIVWIGIALTLLVMPLFVSLFYYRVWILQRVNQVLRIELLDRLQALSLRFHADQRVGDAIYRLYQDSAMVTQLIDVLFLIPLWTVTRQLFTLGVIAIFDWRLSIILALVWPPTLLIGGWASRRMRVAFRRARETNSALTSRIQETLAGIQVIKAYGAEAREQERFEWSSSEAFAAAFSARNFFAIFQVVIFWVLGSFALLAIAIATLETRDAMPLTIVVFSYTAWNLGLYNQAKGLIGGGTMSSREIYKTWGRIQDVAIGLDRVFEVLDLEPEVQDAPDARPLRGVHESVAFRAVHFAYDADRPVLRGVELEAHVGTVTAVVGPTGSGKSTLMALLLRLFDVGEGAVEIDGVDLRRFQTASLRDHVSIALQENVLFGDTVRENIRFARPDATDEEVRAAANVACAAEFIESLDDGYDTLLGERGAKLSTGQRQRLSIARAVLKDTPILVLDEPTASLDAGTELRVMDNLAAWGRGRAIFLITHRLSTIRRAQQIAFLQDGALLELGSHEELMLRREGAYRGLVEAEEGRPQLRAVEAGA